MSAVTITHRLTIDYGLTPAARKAIKRAAATYGLNARTVTHGRHSSTLIVEATDLGYLMDVGDVAIDLGAERVDIRTEEMTIVDPVVGSYRCRILNEGVYAGRGVIA